MTCYRFISMPRQAVFWLILKFIIGICVIVALYIIYLNSGYEFNLKSTLWYFKGSDGVNVQGNEEELQAHWELNASCASFPNFMDFKFLGTQYQLAQSGKISYYLYAAYYDARVSLSLDMPLVVVLAMVNTLEQPYPRNFCQLWYKNNATPHIVEVGEHIVLWYKIWGTHSGYFYPTLIRCQLPDKRVPELVSLVYQQGCARASNGLEVIYEARASKYSKKPRFAVCLRSFNYEKPSKLKRLVEWLELLRLLGVERIIAYDVKLHQYMQRALHFYAVREGLLELRPLEVLQQNVSRGMKPALIERLNEVLLYNDCIYRNMYKYDYIAAIDMDEVIMPLQQLRNWMALVRQLESTLTNEKCPHYASYCFHSVYFPDFDQQPSFTDALPADFYMLQHVKRVAKHLDSTSEMKCLHSTAHVVGIYYNIPLRWNSACGHLNVGHEVAQVQHYGEPSDRATLGNTLLDTNIWRFNSTLIGNALKIYKQFNATP